MSSEAEQSVKILLIDSDRGVARFLEQKLREKGYQICLERSVRGALSLVEDQYFDLVIWITKTPDADDFIALHELKVKQPGMKLIVCGPIGSDTVMDSLAGADVHLMINQSCSAQELIFTIDHVLNDSYHPGFPANQ